MGNNIHQNLRRLQLVHILSACKLPILPGILAFELFHRRLEGLLASLRQQTVPLQFRLQLIMRKVVKHIIKLLNDIISQLL